jgi:NAD(P)-dependent dehydrogenase (short-subunit alcohol dehydrogenase family)/rhamnose utilization protein RhaD (predicted bifunctional aldolase and dehydrogenase)
VDPNIKDLLAMSHGVGRSSRLVQGGGGNTSVKTDSGDRMYVKASGTALGAMREGLGYRLVDVAGCTAMLTDTEIPGMPPIEREAAVLQQLVESCLDDLPGRPSVETSLHAMLGRCVVHTHPSAVNGLLCAYEGRKVLESLFGDMDPPFLYVEYTTPGYVLAARLHEDLGRYRQEHARLPEAVFLENHGLFVTTNDAQRALDLTNEIFNAIEGAAKDEYERADHAAWNPVQPEIAEPAVGQLMAGLRRFYSEEFGRPAVLRFVDDDVVCDFLRMPSARELCDVNILMPDQYVYCKEPPVWVPMPENIEDLPQVLHEAAARAKAGPETALCMVIEGLGLVCAAPSPKFLDAVVAMMRAALEALTIADHFGGARGMEDADIEFLRGWEVERFRTRLAEGDESGRELAGKVAVVTGAGSGLGRGISRSLAAQGVHVFLADIDEKAARETASLMPGTEDAGRGYPARVDVTSEEAVQRLFSHAVRQLGGVDILVNCAGVVSAHPLVSFGLADWRRTLDINLTGYFLVGREAARCMVRQGMGGNIINISSKSGLEASKHNSAYNATKAGQIHLARGWALDLAEHGIRVNSVCPGNVFEGSSIWNDEYIEAIAAKRGIQPEEVIPYYTGLTALKEEITSQDIGDAVAFLASPRASKITGQTLVVDAGQVFVR